MKTLQEVQKSFYWMGLNLKLKPFNRRIISILAVNSPSIISQWLYLIHVADSAQEYMESAYIVTLCNGVLVSFASTIFLTKRLFSYIRSLDEFSNERLENPTSIEILQKTNEFVEKWSKIGILVMKRVAAPCMILPKAIISYSIYFSTDLGNDAFDLPVPMWLPYNWKNPTKYLMTIFLELFLAIYPSQYIGCFTFLAFGVFSFSMAFVKIMKKELHSINKMARHKKSRKNMYKKLCKFIQTHANEKQLTISFSDVYETMLTIVFVCCLITLCAAMLLAQIEISNSETDPAVLVEAAVYGTAVLILLLFVCELGQRFSDLIDEIDDTIVQLDWYLFPGEIQRVLPTLMQSTQKPVVVKCFGSVSCSREQFRKVVKTVYSYFMVLREFYK